MRTDITHHHDGHGLNDVTVIEADDRDPKAGNASHEYRISCPVRPDEPAPQIPRAYAYIQFQHGPRNVEGSTPGVLDGAILAVLIDRYEGFQSGPYACAENEEVLSHLRAALQAMKDRADARAKQGVLGTNNAHKS